MAFQSVPDTAQATVRIPLSTSITAVMTFYFRRTGGYGLALLEALADNVDLWASNHLRPTLSNQISYSGTEVRGLALENDYVAVQDSGAGVGGVASPVLPFQTAFAVKRLSGLTGRSARGRVFWTGLPESWADGQSIGVNEANAVVAALEALDSAIGLTGWTPVIVSRFAGGVKRATALTFPITSWEYDNLVLDTQRRRNKQ